MNRRSALRKLSPLAAGTSAFIPAPVRRPSLVLVAFASLVLGACAAIPSGDTTVVRTDHYVAVTSTAPALAGRETRLYVREVAQANRAARSDNVVVFVHGSPAPGSVAFDMPYKDHSWAGYLAQAGFDAFVVDLTGFGRSTRPEALNDPCNLPKSDRAPFVPRMISADCKPSQTTLVTTMNSDRDDLDAVIEYVRRLRRVDKVALIAWSRGGPIAGGYVARHPEKVSRVFALAPAYPDMPLDAPPVLPIQDGTIRVQDADRYRKEFDSPMSCPGQYEEGIQAAVWDALLAADPVGARWTPPVYRAPLAPFWGFNSQVAGALQTPFAIVLGQHDKAVNPARQRKLYADLGSANKVFVDLACSSHSAMMERNHTLLFRASLEWLERGTIEGRSNGMVKMGY